MSKEYYVYIMTNKSRTLYTGVTNDLMRRVYEHKNKLVKGFTSKYNIQFLVYYESSSSIYSAIEREKQIKGWLRKKKIALIDSMNPEWKDLSEEWYARIIFLWSTTLALAVSSVYRANAMSSSIAKESGMNL
jgi:putative endonuclease